MFDQSQRIDRYTSNELAPDVCVCLRFRTSGTIDDVLERVRSVMRLVAAGQAGTWPTDQEWRQRLPSWFLQSFEGHTLDDILADPDLWDFASWLDAMKGPGWEWWSCGSEDGGGNVRGIAHTDPYAIEPLIYLVRAAGASVVEFHEELPELDR